MILSKTSFSAFFGRETVLGRYAVLFVAAVFYLYVSWQDSVYTLSLVLFIFSGNESVKAAGDVKVEVKQEPYSQEVVPASMIKSEPNVTSLSSTHTTVAPIVAAAAEPSNKLLMPAAKKRKKEW